MKKILTLVFMLLMTAATVKAQTTTPTVSINGAIVSQNNDTFPTNSVLYVQSVYSNVKLYRYGVLVPFAPNTNVTLSQNGKYHVKIFINGQQISYQTMFYIK